MSLVESLIAEFRSAKANGDPDKYVHVISVATAHKTAAQLESYEAEIEAMRVQRDDMAGLILRHQEALEWAADHEPSLVDKIRERVSSLSKDKL